MVDEGLGVLTRSPDNPSAPMAGIILLVNGLTAFPLSRDARWCRGSRIPLTGEGTGRTGRCIRRRKRGPRPYGRGALKGGHPHPLRLA